jgi:hypothetical protein
MPHKMLPATARAKPHPSKHKFLFPFISLNKITPQIAEIADGPLEWIKN